MSDMNRYTRREAGIISIMVTMILMIVISLIVLGLAEISRNEQRSTLDDQLSAQAFYAAESGVNDARTAINTMIAGGAIVQDKTVCGNQGAYTLNNTVNAANNVSYTCVLVTAQPKSLIYNVGYTSTVVPVISADGSAFGTLTLKWNIPVGLPNSVAGCYAGGTPANTWTIAASTGSNGGSPWGCSYPVLRVDLLDANAGLNRASWNATTATMFFVPFQSGGSANGQLTDRGTALPIRCTAGAAGNCTATIIGLGGSKYYMRLTTIYRTNSQLTISNAAGKQFANAQADIDSTGKAQDVLRRILVAVDLTDANAYKVPSGAIVTEDSVCKRFGVTNGSLNVYDDMSAGGGGNPLCNQQSVGVPTP